METTSIKNTLNRAALALLFVAAATAVPGCTSRDPSPGSPKETTVSSSKPTDPAVPAVAPSTASKGASADSRTAFRIQALMHTFWQFYESPRGDLERQLSLLTDDVEIASANLGTTRGHAQYRERVRDLPRLGENAHRLRSFRYLGTRDGIMLAEATLSYQNRSPAGALKGYLLRYDLELVDAAGAFPKLRKVAINPVREEKVEEFSDALLENRVNALVKSWLAGMENIGGGREELAALLARDGFLLDFSSAGAPMTDLAQLDRWLASVAARLEASSHEVEDLKFARAGDGAVEVGFLTRWSGRAKDGSALSAVTRHAWKAVEGPGGRLAIKEVRVKSDSDIKMVK